MSNLKWILLGGVAVALLTPKTGKELRNDSKKAVENLVEDIKNLSAEDMKRIFGEKVDLVKSYVTNLDFSKMKDTITEVILNKKDEITEIVKNKKTKGKATAADAE